MKGELKQLIARTLRSCRLLPLADYTLYCGNRLRTLGPNRAFRAAHPEFVCPPPALSFDAYNHVSCREYYESGRLHAALVAGVARDSLGFAGVRVCEWGCGPGRILRHLAGALDDLKPVLHGTDYNSHSVDWCNRNLPEIDWRVNQLTPPLPYEDERFDFVYAVSIFTHLSEQRYVEWLPELQRVTRKGGAILFTTHGKHYVNQLLGDEADRYNAGRIVERTQIAEGKKGFVAYHPPAYIRATLPPGLKIERHDEGAPDNGLVQDIWILRRV